MACDMSLENLTAVVIGCRLGFESLASSKHSLLRGFPTGSCGVASEIVGRILKETFSCEGYYVCGRSHMLYGEEQSHAWIETNGYLIDVTYDQFKDTGLSGLVFEGATDWHRGFLSRDVREGFCMPAGWPCYPFDGYKVALDRAREALDALTKQKMQS